MQGGVGGGECRELGGQGLDLLLEGFELVLETGLFRGCGLLGCGALESDDFLVLQFFGF